MVPHILRHGGLPWSMPLSRPGGGLGPFPSPSSLLRSVRVNVGGDVRLRRRLPAAASGSLVDSATDAMIEESF